MALDDRSPLHAPSTDAGRRKKERLAEEEGGAGCEFAGHHGDRISRLRPW